MTVNSQTELFVELNDEQAEIVSGGATLGQLTITGFAASQDVVLSNSQQGSGAGGSLVNQSNGALSQNLVTGALNGLLITT